MNMIVAADRNWGIGKDGQLLFHIPEDMAFFKSQTMGNVVVMGRKTFDSLPGKKALPGRTNLVLTGNPDWKGEGAQAVNSPAELEELLKKWKEDQIYIIGGGQIYRRFLDRCSCIYVTHIDAAPAADTWFPDLEQDGRFRKECMLQKGTWKDISYEIWKWSRKS